MESTYMHQLKEADVLKHRNPLVNTMQKRDHAALWKGLCDYKFDAFWNINRRLMALDAATHEDAAGSADATATGHFRHIPFRLYLAGKSSSGPGAMSAASHDATPMYTQKLVSPITESGDPALFGNLLEATLKQPSQELAEKYRF